MTIDDGRTAIRHVAVGRTRQSAAAVFGRHDDDVFITSYQDFEREVDLTVVTSLDLLVDEGSDHVLQQACDRVMSGQCAVRVAVRPGATGRLSAVLDHAGVTIVAVESVGSTPLLSIGSRTADHSVPASLVLAALDAGADAGTDAPERHRSGPPPASANPRRPTPPLVKTLARVESWRRGRRRRTAALGALVVAVLVMLLIGLVPSTTQVLVSIGVPLLVVLVVVAAAISTYTTLLLARQVHRQNGRLERLVLRNRQVAQKQAHRLAQRLDRVEKTQSRLPFMEQYLEAVAEHGAATSARLEELLDEDKERLAFQTVERSRPSQ